MPSTISLSSFTFSEVISTSFPPLTGSSPSTALTAGPSGTPTPSSERADAPLTATTTLGNDYPYGTLSPACGTNAVFDSLDDRGTNGSVAIGPLNSKTFGYLKNCCKGAPIIEYNGCLAACHAIEQSVDDLNACLEGFPGLDTVIEDFHDPSLDPTTTSSSVSTGTSASASATSSKATGAAAALRPSVGEGHGKAALFLCGTILFSILAGATIIL